MKTLGAICSVLLFLLTIAAPSSAEMIAEGIPVTEGSWTQRFQENGVYGGVSGQFDLIAVQIVPEATFETSTLSGFSDTSWTMVYEGSFTTPTTPTIASAMGPTSTSLQFDLKFAGDKANSLSYHYVAYDGETLRGGGTCSWNGSTWTCLEGITSPEWAPTRLEIVPEPGTMALLIVGGFSALAAVWNRRPRGMK